jgi:hypothetical protein
MLIISVLFDLKGSGMLRCSSDLDADKLPLAEYFLSFRKIIERMGGDTLYIGHR